jgi:hypothetical protein
MLSQVVGPSRSAETGTSRAASGLSGLYQSTFEAVARDYLARLSRHVRDKRGVTDEVPAHHQPPPPPPPKLAPTRLEVPEPDLTFDVPPDANTIRDALTEQPPYHPSPPSPPVLNRVLGGRGKGFPNTDDYYPSASRRLGEEGITSVRVC